MHDQELLNGWLPYRLFQDNDGAIKFRWLYIGDRQYTEPFFEDFVRSCLSLPQNRPGHFPVTSAEQLVRIADLSESVLPLIIVYHISRCGSTLLSQMLTCDPANIVLSEVPLLDALLRLPKQADAVNNHLTEQLFKSVLKLLCRRRSGKEKRVFLKTDSWHVLFHRQMEAWFPEATCFLMYRDPKEVGASQSKMPAMHSVPGVIEPSLFGLEKEECAGMTRDEYLDHVLACYFTAYKEIVQSGKPAFLLSYHDGVMKMPDIISEACGFQTDENVLNGMRSRAEFHSKNPGKNFTGDSPSPSGIGEFMKSQKLLSELKQCIAEKKVKIYETR